MAEPLLENGADAANRAADLLARAVEQQELFIVFTTEPNGHVLMCSNWPNDDLESLHATLCEFSRRIAEKIGN